MSLLRRFDEDLREALKASEKARISTLRMVKAAIKNKEIEKGRGLTDEEIISVLSTMLKQRKESIEQFSKAGRDDLVRKEEQEIEILQSYMPRQLSSDEIDKLILDAIGEVSAMDVQDAGKVMRLLMPRIRGVADGRYVNQRVRELLEAGKRSPE